MPKRRTQLIFTSSVLLYIFVSVNVELLKQFNGKGRLHIALTNQQLAVVPTANTTEVVVDDPCVPLTNPSRLEFVHIPKAGGSSLEVLGAKFGIAWSACHWLTKYGETDCPGHPIRPQLHHAHNVKNWHVPPIHFDASKAPFNPYDNATLFTVVRDPYSRMVSEYKYNKWVRNWDPFDASKLNAFLIRRLRRLANDNSSSNVYFMGDGHFIPQVDFIRGNEDRMHVLHQERLSDDFACLVRRYRLPTNMTLHALKVNASPGALSVHNLTRLSRQLIEQVYAEDFKQFGYPIITD